ncbi:tetratricopeptide repeat protein [Polymorphospora rubra]|uniref:tetratricopeptide repeat protein n=1 Tax=Polymorphospora rubra TaxID=338584 RepID=UPI001FE82A9E|nr:tetratricopeptide repeat protein [Polymorphospora rubra]
MLSLAKPVAETVARHLVATGLLIDEEPEEALAHALAARRLASRIAAVREAVGLAAYRAGEWQTAIAELRTYHRMSGRQTHLAVLADSERALGRPERAIDLFRGADRDALDPATAIELLIVAAGARGDLGQGEAAVAMLQVRELSGKATEPWAGRLRYAYADSLLAVGRRDEAREWFARAVEADEDGETDAAERLLELDGVQIEGDDEELEDGDETAVDDEAEGLGDDDPNAAADDDTVPADREVAAVETAAAVRGDDGDRPESDATRVDETGHGDDDKDLSFEPDDEPSAVASGPDADVDRSTGSDSADGDGQTGGDVAGTTGERPGPAGQ